MAPSMICIGYPPFGEQVNSNSIYEEEMKVRRLDQSSFSVTRLPQSVSMQN